MLGHTAISQVPISTSSVIVEIIVDGKPLVWVLTRKNNKWTVRELKDTWVVKAKGNKWYKNN
jgi:hypothetical protein